MSDSTMLLVWLIGGVCFALVVIILVGSFLATWHLAARVDNRDRNRSRGTRGRY